MYFYWIDCIKIYPLYSVFDNNINFKKILNKDFELVTNIKILLEESLNLCIICFHITFVSKKRYLISGTKTLKNRQK